MASEIRALLAAAQSAEVKGDHRNAVRLLREAAAFYRDRKLVTRAMQMLRHARRLEGHEDLGSPLDGVAPRELAPTDDFDGPIGLLDCSSDDDVDDDVQFGFGDELVGRDESASISKSPEKEGEFERTLVLAEPSLQAWCSFCCRPSAEVGSLVAGPTNAYVCVSCIARAAGLLRKSGESTQDTLRHEVQVERSRFTTAPIFLLEAQRAAHAQYLLRKPRLALIIGPEGSGKSELLRALGPSHAFDGVVPPDFVLSSSGTTVIAIRGDLPVPSLVLMGEQGPEPIFDTEALAVASKRQLSAAVLSKVETTLGLPALDVAALTQLAEQRLAARGVTVPSSVVGQLVAIAQKSGRGAHELVALVARIPAGQYQAP